MTDEASTGTLIVTGGSRGIGAACAFLAAKKGYKVAVNYASNEAAAKDVVTGIRSNGGEAIAVQGDVAVEGDILKIFRQAADQLGPITGLVNNAGVLDQEARLDSINTDRISRIIAVNVIGSMICAREAVKAMSTKFGGNGGAIVNLSSIAAVLGAPALGVDYAASKGAIDSFTIGLAREVAGEGIRVNAVRPGIIDTEIHASFGIPDRVEKMKHAVPMQRGGTAGEVADVILWLMSNKASYVTGSIVDISGGR